MKEEEYILHIDDYVEQEHEAPEYSPTNENKYEKDLHVSSENSFNTE